MPLQCCATWIQVVATATTYFGNNHEDSVMHQNNPFMQNAEKRNNPWLLLIILSLLQFLLLLLFQIESNGIHVNGVIGSFYNQVGEDESFAGMTLPDFIQHR